jgi:hypothetical protein
MYVMVVQPLNDVISIAVPYERYRMIALELQLYKRNRNKGNPGPHISSPPPTFEDHHDSLTTLRWHIIEIKSSHLISLTSQRQVVALSNCRIFSFLFVVYLRVLKALSLQPATSQPTS